MPVSTAGNKSAGPDERTRRVRRPTDAYMAVHSGRSYHTRHIFRLFVAPGMRKMIANCLTKSQVENQSDFLPEVRTGGSWITSNPSFRFPAHFLMRFASQTSSP